MSSQVMRTLATTSYAVLGLLTFGQLSAYELAKLMARSLDFLWPRAESKVDEEPKKPVEHGLATVDVRRCGRQRRTVYAITPAGREALARWLATPFAPRLLEFEGLLRVYFASATTAAPLQRRERVRCVAIQAVESWDSSEAGSAQLVSYR